MARKLENWLDSYVNEYTAQTESPLAYRLWVGISVLAGALGRKTWVSWDTLIYPNMYIILVGPAAGSRKGTAMAPGINLYADAELPTASKKFTAEGLADEMAKVKKEYLDPDTGKGHFQCAASCFSTELIVTLGQQDSAKLGWLTDLYDCLPTWASATRYRGQEVLRNSCLNFLGATSPDWLPSIFPMDAIGGGYTSRVIFVVESTKGEIAEGRPVRPEANEQLHDELLSDLLDIGAMAGEMTISKKAEDAMLLAYKKQEQELRKGNKILEGNRMESYVGRRQTHMRKLAMVLSAARSNERIIKLEDWERAVEILTKTEKTMPRAFTSLGYNKDNIAASTIVTTISHHKTIARGKLLSAIMNDVDLPTFVRVVSLLQEAGVIKVTGSSSNPTYELKNLDEKL